MGVDDYYDFLESLDNSYDTIETQIRVHGATTNNFEYLTNIDASMKFLRNNVNKKLDMAIVFVDMVESTRLSMALPEHILTILMTAFSHEMAHLIEKFNGYVLKFVGDAVIGYFVGADSADHAVQCAKGMVYNTKYGLNKILSKIIHDNIRDQVDDALDRGNVTDGQSKLLEDIDNLKRLAVRLGLNFGKNTVVRYGRASQDCSIVDLIGYPLNITAKIQSKAKINQILIGEDLYDKLSESAQAGFVEVSNDELDYCHPETDNKIKLYSFDKFD